MSFLIKKNLFIIVFIGLLIHAKNVNCDETEKARRISSKATDSALVFVANGANDGDSSEDQISISVDEEDEDTSMSKSIKDPFVPTDEWQVVKEGQVIPPGLHVQMDFKTGVKRAKLLSEIPKRELHSNENDKGDTKTSKRRTHGSTRWDAGETLGFIHTNKKRYTREELKRTLKNFKYSDLTPHEKSEKEFGKKFRKYEELKKVLSDSRMAVKTEAEIVTELLNRLKQAEITTTESITVLTDLEYYLHQIDNGQLLVTQGGLLLLKNLLNGSDSEVQAAAAHALGASWQSNAKVQVAAVDSGLMQQLLATLSTDSSVQVHKKAIFALSTLVRQFPFAQKKLLDTGGLSVLADIFKKTSHESLQIKIITLLTDLLLEYDHNTKNSPNDSLQDEKTLQYKKMELRGTMSSSGWCNLMVSLLNPMAGHDHVEKLTTAMIALAETCRHEFQPARTKLKSLMTQYMTLAQEEEDEEDGFFNSIFISLQKVHDEL